MTYRESIMDAMAWLGQQSDTVFIGQTTVYGGSYFARSLEKVPGEKRTELPVMEEAQMGITLGLALEGLVPVSIYPRIDFLLLAANQLVNHVDKIGDMSGGKMRPTIIIRTSVGPKNPLDGGPQHTQDHTRALGMLLKGVHVVRVGNLGADTILKLYQAAYWNREGLPATLFVESGELYQQKGEGGLPTVLGDK